MSLLSLPDDNLIQIFKKMDASSIEKLKQANSRFRNIIINKKLDYVEAQRLIISCGPNSNPDEQSHIRWTLEVEIYSKSLQKTFAIKKMFEISRNVLEEEVIKHVKKALKKFKLKFVKSIHFDDTYSGLDANLFFTNCELDFSRLHTCEGTFYNITLNFLDDSFFKTRVSKNPDVFNFAQCKTNATTKGIMAIVKEYFKNDLPCVWYFGEIPMTRQDHRLIQELQSENCLVVNALSTYHIIKRLTHDNYKIIQFTYL